MASPDVSSPDVRSPPGRQQLLCDNPHMKDQAVIEVTGCSLSDALQQQKGASWCANSEPYEHRSTRKHLDRRPLLAEVHINRSRRQHHTQRLNRLERYPLFGSEQPTQRNTPSDTEESFSVLYGEIDLQVLAGSRYRFDYRNLRHSEILWTACLHHHCAMHYSEKARAKIFLSKKPICTYTWYNCTDDICETHLWDKRKRSYFPGHHDPGEFLVGQVAGDTSCCQPIWQLCLSPDCTKHRKSKKFHGFDQGTGTKDRLSFLTKNQVVDFNLVLVGDFCTEDHARTSR